MPIFFKSGNLNLLAPSGSVQACNGIALSFNKKYSTVHLASSTKYSGAVPRQLSSGLSWFIVMDEVTVA
jgi:hypothetical protein